MGCCEYRKLRIQGLAAAKEKAGRVAGRRLLLNLANRSSFNAACKARHGREIRDSQRPAAHQSLPWTDSRPVAAISLEVMVNRSEIETAVLKACRDDGGPYVVDKLLELMAPAVATLWLEGQNAHLGGAQPIIVLHLEGSRPVLAALRSFEQGAFA
jgi:hypothetical protein